MKILLIVPKYPHMWWIKQPPIGVLYTATILKSMGNQVEIVDLRYNNNETWRSHLSSADIVILFTSEYDLTQCYPWNLKEINQTINLIKSINQFLPIVAAGPHGCIDSKLTLNELKVDGILKGENEVVIPKFISEYHNYKDKHKYIYASSEKANLENIPVPDYDLCDLSEYESYVPIDGLIKKMRTGLLFANRGCPFQCDYCYNGYFGNNVRFRPVNLVIDEIKAQHQRGINNFFFLDYTFTVNKNWVANLLTEIKKLDFEITFGCETRIDCIDSQLLKLMAQAGCKYIWYGIESPQIDSITLNKKINKERIDEVLNNTKESDIQAMAFILVGFPNENIDLIYEWCKSHDCIFDHSIIFPRPGTALHESLKGRNCLTCNNWFELEEKSSLLLYNDRNLVIEKFNKLTTLNNYFDNVFTKGKISYQRDGDKYEPILE